MAATTMNNVLDIAPELANVDLATWNLILSDVARDVSSSVYGTRQEQAQRYLAAHYLTIIRSDPLYRPNAAGPVGSESAGQASANYAAIPYKDRNRYDETKYGRVFNSIRKGIVIPFRVYTP
jgi:hypothetical protein